MESDRDQQYWLDQFEGEAKGGYFVRNDLVNSVKRLEAEGLKVVGIRFDGTFNLELITALGARKKADSPANIIEQ